jgi:hypothetical protein
LRPACSCSDVGSRKRLLQFACGERVAESSGWKWPDRRFLSRGEKQHRNPSAVLMSSRLAQRYALGMPEYVFRINLGLDLHQSRKIIAPIGPGVTIAEIEIAIVYVAST